MKKMFVSLAATAAALMATNASAATVVNGSFESPVINNFSYAPDPNTVTTSYVSIAGVAANGGAFGYSTTIGNQVGFLQANASTFGTINQVVSDLVAGQRYTLTFFSSQRGGYAVLPINVAFNNQYLGTVTPTSTTFTANSLFSFLATGTEGTLSFYGAVQAGDINAAIDGISVANATAAVPEPATWGMMLVGFGMIGFGMRRRKADVRTSVRFA